MPWVATGRKTVKHPTAAWPSRNKIDEQSGAIHVAKVGLGTTAGSDSPVRSRGQKGPWKGRRHQLQAEGDGDGRGRSSASESPAGRSAPCDRTWPCPLGSTPRVTADGMAMRVPGMVVAERPLASQPRRTPPNGSPIEQGHRRLTSGASATRYREHASTTRTASRQFLRKSEAENPHVLAGSGSTNRSPFRGLEAVALIEADVKLWRIPTAPPAPS